MVTQSKTMMVCVATFVMSLVFASTAVAYVPFVHTWDKKWIKVRKPMEKSAAHYLSFERPGDVDLFTIHLQPEDFRPGLTFTSKVKGEEQVVPLIVTDEDGMTGRQLYVGTLVPACDTYVDLLPTVALVGPVQRYLPPQNLVPPQNLGHPILLAIDGGKI